MNQEQHASSFPPEIKTRLEKMIRIKSFFGRLYWILNNWFHAISWTIAIATPFLMASIVYVTNIRETMGLYVLILTAVGTVCSLGRSAFQLAQHAKHTFQQKADAQSILDEISLGTINNSELANRLRTLGLSDLDEPIP